MPYPPDPTDGSVERDNRRASDMAGLTVPERPVCLETEAAVLSLAMTCGTAPDDPVLQEALQFLLDELELAHFYAQANRSIWYQIVSLIEAGQSPDFLAVARAIKKDRSCGLGAREISAYMVLLDNYPSIIGTYKQHVWHLQRLTTQRLKDAGQNQQG